MSLDSANYPSELSINDPPSSDPVGQSDDHIRTVKRALNQGFPNVAGEVSGSDVELSYVTGVTSSIQPQLDLKAPISSPVFTGNISTSGSITAGTSLIIGSANVNEAELGILDGATVTTTELNSLDGITATATELNKMDGCTASTSELNVLDGITPSTAELNRVEGVTSNIQSQLNGKAPEETRDFSGDKWTSGGGFRMMWGTGTSNSSGKETVSFTPDFGNIETVMVTDMGATTGTVKNWSVTGLDEQGFDAYVSGGGSGHTFRWLAIGSA